jgi:predicted regulator of Ras-like GTPase activity (Roadblock/LC7/MglB family)
VKLNALRNHIGENKVNQQLFVSILENLNATSADIRASLFMTKDGLPLVSASSTSHLSQEVFPDENKISVLSACILRLGHELMTNFVGGELDHFILSGKNGCILVIHGEELALAVLIKSDAKADLIFPQMEHAFLQIGSRL